MEINRIGNKNCWIKNGFQHWRFFNRGCLLILRDHLFLNCIFWGGRRRLINNGLLINPDLTLPVTWFTCLLRRLLLWSTYQCTPFSWFTHTFSDFSVCVRQVWKLVLPSRPCALVHDRKEIGGKMTGKWIWVNVFKWSYCLMMFC